MANCTYRVRLLCVGSWLHRSSNRGVLSRSGHRVIGVDVSSHVLDTVNQGRVHIVEPDLEDVVADAVSL